MADEIDEQAPEAFDLQRWLDVARRRQLHFLMPLLFGWLIVWGVSWVIPPVYRSGTLILVEQPTMPKAYVTPNVSDDLQERLQSITQQILSRTRLVQIIDQVNIYGDERKPMSPDEKVERMRKNIEIELVHDAHNDKITAFNVSYSSRDPHLAQKVTSQLTNLFINENVEVRQQLSEDTTQFLQNQLETARNTLAEQEEKVREFKGQHVGEMPAQQQSNLQILSGLQAQLQSGEDALNTARQQRIYLQTLIDQYRTMQGAVSTGGGAPDSLPAIDKELERLKTQLAELSSRYTDRHPDIRKVKEQIAQTEKTRDSLIAALARKSAMASTDDSTKAASASDLTPNSPIMQLQGQLHANQVEIASRERAIAELKTSINGYQARLNQEPVREQQLADLTRGYDQSKANYDDLLKKKNESEMATSMERLQQGERFRVLDPPSLPGKPDFPNRLKFCGMGLGVGLMLGLVVAGGFEFFDDRMHSEQEIKDLIPVGIMVEIPEVLNFSDQQSTKRKMRFTWAMTGLVVVMILAGSAVSFLYG
jgi:polysaccharide chain length determinant protein (PEP-CTERM system associated)